jgi:TPP-dependent pyruvate/acetoin dehydrogenase alpha subunit
VKTGGVSALALGCGVPAIAVDADDAVAIYRVAQESIGHARIGGGAALIECVPFVLAGTTATAKRNVANDAIAGLEQYMVQRGVVTKAWMDRAAKSFAKRLAK